ncbi:sulfotransferase family protein [Niveispirillum sp. BGYR6]|uniref:sulfotransferase family protein n=1 Tax=Niveispirillum sp. BGYR6 TaxID=2971249 RepID=UPI0022B956FE|nr:sulfotransferase family protein [Niveispirillum sp. BGYR6]MDG5496350.1 sulfotransferase family protein [Niveispirillum sp. BGYR6]
MMTARSNPYGDLSALAARIEGEDPQLDNLLLPADGFFQKAETSQRRLTDQVALALRESFAGWNAADFPTLYCAWGRARTGSTALANLFGTAGLPSYYQPVKALMRQFLAGDAVSPWQPPRENFFCKDVAGPYTLAECLYIPAQMLVEAGYPPEKLHLVILDRQPERSLGSWLRKWSGRLERERLLAHFVCASMNTLRVEAHARRYGIAVTHYVYEAAQEPALAIPALFNRLGLGPDAMTAALKEWTPLDSLDAEGSRVIFPVEPDAYVVPGLHRADADGYRYRPGTCDGVTQEDRALLYMLGVEAAYQRNARACRHELGLPARLLTQTMPPIAAVA